MKTKILIATLFVLLLISVFFNIIPDSDLWYANFTDANTRPTYNDFHNIKEAQQIATGKGIKVGIIGKYFGYANNKNVFAGGNDFVGNKTSFEEFDEHGLWMANTLKEIAPDVEVYALNARDNDHDKECDAIIEAIDWAIENDIDILTYSAEAFLSEYRDKIDKQVIKAVDNNIVPTFIHYDLPENILPYGLFPRSPSTYAREADVNIFHFDYNLLLLFKYENYVASGRKETRNIGSLPYYSNSSMSPVLAGIIAMMKEVNNDLSVAEYKQILIETSREMQYKDYVVKHVVDAAGALNYLQKNK